MKLLLTAVLTMLALAFAGCTTTPSDRTMAPPPTSQANPNPDSYPLDSPNAAPNAYNTPAPR